MWLAKHIVFLCWMVLWEQIEAVVNNENGVKSFVKNYNRHSNDITIHKVSLTQEGYIQFLRYNSKVPPLTDYTFCIWVRSNNFTYSHPLLSYSKHEEERLIRVWISSEGADINLEILGNQIFKIPVYFLENHWYHICQSWSSNQAAWNLYLNGKLKSTGYAPKLRGVKIKGGGDIVVGQEYTDFDKGLDDGIEGDVFGFNFVLSPTSYSSRVDFPSRRHHVEGIRPAPTYYAGATEVPDVLSYFSVEPNRKPKGFSSFFGNMFGVYDPPQVVRWHAAGNKRLNAGSRLVNDIDESSPKPTGLRLVELGYNCFLGRGAPVSGKEVLISWTKTPVRVFGGAILKNIPPFCT